MLNPKLKREKRFRHHKRVRVKISGTSKVPRLCVFKSAKHIYAQLIDDEKSRTLAAAGDLKLNLKTELPKEAKVKKRTLSSSPTRAAAKGEEEDLSSSPTKSLKEKKEEVVRTGKVAVAFEVGKLIAKKALDLPAGRHGKKIGKVVFDRGGYRYLGRVRALAEGAREGGLKF